jgi:hypothetical protein
MNSHEFYLWLNGYLEALESEGIEVCKIKNIREKINEIKNRSSERVLFAGPNVTPSNPQRPGYDKTPPSNRSV